MGDDFVWSCHFEFISATQSSRLSSILATCSIQPLNANSDSLTHTFSACHSNYYYPAVKVQRVGGDLAWMEIADSHRRLPLSHFRVFKENLPKEENKEKAKESTT